MEKVDRIKTLIIEEKSKYISLCKSNGTGHTTGSSSK